MRGAGGISCSSSALQFTRSIPHQQHPGISRSARLRGCGIRRSVTGCFNGRLSSGYCLAGTDRRTSNRTCSRCTRRDDAVLSTATACQLIRNTQTYGVVKHGHSGHGCAQPSAGLSTPASSAAYSSTNITPDRCSVITAAQSTSSAATAASSSRETRDSSSDEDSDASSSTRAQPAVRYSTAFGGGPGIIDPAVPPAGLSSISSYDDDDLAQQQAEVSSSGTDAAATTVQEPAVLHEPAQGSTVQQQQQQQQPQLDRSSGSAAVAGTTLDSVTLYDENQQQDQQQQRQQRASASDSSATAASSSTVSSEGGGLQLPGQQASEIPPVGTSSSSSSSSGADLLMSFMEEDLGNITTMYDVISRASTVVHQQKQEQQRQRQQQYTLPQQPPQQQPASSLGSSSSTGSIMSSSLSSQDTAALSELQIATEKKLVELQHAVEELQLGEEATQQLTDVLHKLEQLEQDLSAVVHSTSSTSSVDSAPTSPTAAAASGAAVSERPAAAAVAAPAVDTRPQQPPPPSPAAASAGTVAVAHTLEMEALAASAAMGGAASPPAELLESPAAPAAAPPAAAAPAAAVPGITAADSTRLWPLFVLGLSYVHQATSGFALPALLPMISPDLNLTDFQGALLTSGYSYLYALALVPVGLLADKFDRPKLLAVGLALWSSLSIVSSGARSFGELLFARTGFAIAQAAQNPVSFSLIPDLFPANKSTALAAYNCAIYLGRALSFAALLAAHRVSAASKIPGGKLPGAGTMAEAAAGNAGDGVALSMVPLDALDLQRMSIIYTSGDMAAVTPLYNYNFHVIAYEAVAGGIDGWRQLLTWIGYPGFVIGLIMLLTVREPRHDNEPQQQQGSAAADGGKGALSATTSALRQSASQVTTQLFNVATGHGWHGSNGTGSTGGTSSSSSHEPDLAGPACIVEPHLQPATAAAAAAGASATVAVPVQAEVLDAQVQTSAPAQSVQQSENPILSLLKIKPFQATTIAAALNDVGSYSLIAWHSTFYERVFGLDSGVYAPMLAVILPVGGIVGGVGGGLIADWLSVVGGRYWLTAGASLLAAPFVAQSLLAQTPAGSFTALLAGFALSEAWRAPGAIMIRNVAPQELGSTASALYLCIRNLIGGFGPVAVAKLAEVVGLQHAMLLAPACYVVSGLIFYIAEKEIEDLNQQQQQKK